MLTKRNASVSSARARARLSPMHCCRALVSLLVLAMPAIAHADDAVAYTPPDFLATTPPLPSTIDATSAWKLDLAEALQLAVKQNLGVTLERTSTRVAELGVTVARGLFEPTLEQSYAHSSSRIPPANMNEGMAGDTLLLTNDRWQLSLGQRL